MRRGTGGRRQWLPMLLLLFRAFTLAAQEPPDEPEMAEDLDDYIILQESDRGVEIVGVAEDAEQADTPNTVTRAEMDREGSRDLWQAVRNVPGITLSGGGPRNDSGISVRGFDSASVPVFVDGVTQANPYRGDNDAARMLTGDLESIAIEKGFSTLLLGPNTMGGAVLIRTARPKEPLEASISSSFGFDSLGKPADSYHIASIGVKRALFYGKTAFQYRGVDHFRIPYGFEPSKNNPQDKGDRLWSAFNDIKLTLIAGWTPFYNMDFSLTWIYQDSYKGFSPPAVNGRDYEIWEWPYYKRQSASFQGEWRPGAFTVKTAAYFQKFDNRLLDYVNWASYEADMPAAPSDYDDYTAGFRLEGGWAINPLNTLEAALNFRRDDHRGLTGGEEGVHVTEDTWSLAAAFTSNPLPPLRVKAAAGFDILSPDTFWGKYNELARDNPMEYVEKTPVWKLWAAEAGVFYRLAGDNELRVTYARKNHFPTMFQRYSSRIGEIKPNPHLGPEWADHFEAGYTGRPLAAAGRPRLDGLKLSLAVYYSLVTQKIVEIRVPKPDFTAVTVPYSVNLDSTAVWGIETALDWDFSPAFTVGGSLSWNRYHILKTSNGVEALTLYPAVTAAVHAEFAPVPALRLIPALRYVGSRFADSAAETELSGYFLVSLKAVCQLGRRFTLSASVDNLFDELYEIRPYFPQPGRTYQLSVTARY
ncbi:MAG: TonB-dependent receptor [Spirochaetaceae bacterium]|jgi:iron complex outermembrane receptor protein|nr:TonB-dependent receptor [Spirochaetaceae bacterium]